MDTKVCRKCKVAKPYTQFSLNKRPNGRDSSPRSDCKQCRAEQARSPEGNRKRRSQALMRDYGITYSEYLVMREKQDNKCSICEVWYSPNRHFDVDHDHTKSKGDVGYVRGLLCNNCNRGIGHLKDDVSYLERAIMYLTE